MRRNQLPSRRDFLRQGAAGLAGGALLASSACSPRSDETPPGGATSTYRTLGRTGLRLPVVSMGSAYGINLVRTALAEGVVYIHTSSSYAEANHERLLGKVFRDRPRSSFVIGTSPDLPYPPARGRSRSRDLGLGADPGRIAQSLERSLQRLGLDHVDIYYLASVGRPEVTHEPYIRAYTKLKAEGKVRFTGIATHENEPDVIRAAAESGAWDVVLTAFNFRQSHREEIRAAIHEAAEAGLGIVAMKTQAGVYWDRRRTRMINMKAALKWVLQDEHVHTTIPAFSNFQEMREDLSIMEDLTLTPDERRDLALGEELGLSGLYCQQCKQCLDQCPLDVDIPRLMRSHMYAVGHQEPGKARETLRSFTSADIPCASCSRCEVACSLGFDVRTRALDVASILDVSGEAFGQSS